MFSVDALGAAVKDGKDWFKVLEEFLPKTPELMTMILAGKKSSIGPRMAKNLADGKWGDSFGMDDFCEQLLKILPKRIQDLAVVAKTYLWDARTVEEFIWS